MYLGRIISSIYESWYGPSLYLFVSRFDRLKNRTMVTCQICMMITYVVVADSVFFSVLCYVVLLT